MQTVIYIDNLVTHEVGIMNTDGKCATFLMNTDELCDQGHVCEH